MKIYKPDIRFAIEELKNGYVNIFFEGKLMWKALNKEAAFQKIWIECGKRKRVVEEDFEEVG